MSPRFSICTPIYGLSMPRFEACASSVVGQSLTDWEWCVVDDRTTDLAVTRCLDELSRGEPRVRRRTRDAWAGAAAASAAALDAATGEFVVLLDPGEQLVPDALAVVDETLRADPTIDVVYADEARLADDGTVAEPFLKPDWSPERLRSQNYVGHPVVLCRRRVSDVGGLRTELEGAHQHDLVLRVTERARRVHHVPRVLSHRRAVGPDVEFADAGEGSAQTGRRAVAEHLERSGISATVEILGAGNYRVRRRLPDPPPTVSVILPTAGTSRPVWGIDRPLVYRCLQSLVEVTGYPHLEVIVVVDPTTPATVTDELRSFAEDVDRWVPTGPFRPAGTHRSARDADERRVVVVEADGPFNFSRRINLGAEHASGQLLVLLNDDMLIEQPDWLNVMAGFTREPDVGAVGCRLLYADGTLQHAGLLCNGQPLHIFHGFAADEPGPFGLLQIDREVSVVTGACLLTSRAVFDELGGLPEHFAVTANDLEYCLRVRRSGRRVVWTPHATLYHFESQTRAPDAAPDEVAELYRRWGDELHHDPYGNPNFAPKQALWRPAEPPTAGDRAGSAARRVLRRARQAVPLSSSASTATSSATSPVARVGLTTEKLAEP